MHRQRVTFLGDSLLCFWYNVYMARQSDIDLTAGRLNQLLYLAADGDTDAVISQKLDISVNTVATYWKRLRKKTGLAKRSAIIVALLKESHQREVELRERAEAELKRLNEELSENYTKRQLEQNHEMISLQSKLLDANKATATIEHMDRCLCSACAIAYEFANPQPVVFRFVRFNGCEFTRSPHDIERGAIKYYDVIQEEDLAAIYELSHDIPYRPNWRTILIYRMKLSRLTWFMDIQMPRFDDSGQLTGVPGLVLNIDYLVTEGIIPAKPMRFDFPVEPASSPSQVTSE